MTRKLIIDCDPGIDDAVALTLALFDPRLEVLAATATGVSSFVAGSESYPIDEVFFGHGAGVSGNAVTIHGPITVGSVQNVHSP